MMFTLAFSAAAVLTASSASAAEKAAIELRPVLAEFATCVAKRNPKLAKSFVNGRPGSALGTRDFQKLFSPQCLGSAGTFRFPPVILKGAISEALLHSSYDITDDLQPAVKAQLDWSPDFSAPVDSPDKNDKSSDESVRRTSLVQESILGQIGECTVRAQPVQVRGLFNTVLNSVEEKAAGNSLATSIAGCLPEGQPLTLDRTNMRSMLATAYYRLASAVPINGTAR